MLLPSTLMADLRAVLRSRGLIEDPGALASYHREERGLYEGAAPVVARPASTEQTAAVLRLCHRAGVAVVPQGGNTGLCGGAVAAEGEVILSLGRMTAVREVDAEGFAMILEAGVTLAQAQEVAARAGRFFPLALGAQGTCQIGGNLATNAGGAHVLKYGGARDLCLGLEVALADGTVWNGLKKLRKDNTGYALKHLFIGAEGTLGVITAAALKLFPALAERRVALCALPSVDAAPALLSLFRAQSGDALSAFELIPGFGLDIARRHVRGMNNPLADTPAWAALAEVSSPRAQGNLRAVFEHVLERAFERGLIADAAIAESGAQEAMLWRLREGLPEAQKAEGASIKHDVSVPLSAIPELIRRGVALAKDMIPGVRPCPFGHVGDGNIHFNFSQPKGADPKAFLAQRNALSMAIHDVVEDLGGSISAEHGVGRLKVAEIERLKQPAELAMMRAVKRALDPAGTLNPGAVVRL